MKRLYISLTLCGMFALFLWGLLLQVPLASAQSQQQIDEMCEEFRRMQAEMGQERDNPMVQQLMQQFEPIRQQCAPGFAAKRAAETPFAPPTAYGNYRLVLDQHRESWHQFPDGGNGHLVFVSRAQVDFSIGPGQKEFPGKGTLQYLSGGGEINADGCQMRYTVTPVTHPANVSARMNPDGQTLHVYVDDLHTGGAASVLHAVTSCPDQYGQASAVGVSEDDIFVMKLPLRHGAQINEVSEAGGIRLNVKATLYKL